MSFVVSHPSAIAGRQVLHGPSGFYGLEDLRDGRDLKHSTDYRSLMAEILERRMGFFSADIFPDYVAQPLGLIT